MVGYNFCTGSFQLDGAVDGDFSDLIIEGTGTTGDYVIRDVYAATTGATAVTTTCPFKFRGNGSLTSATNGILYTSNVTKIEVSGKWGLLATAGTGLGVNATGAIEATIDGVETEGFLSHIIVSFSTDCAVVNCIGRKAGTHITSTSASGLATGNNFIIV